MGCVCGKASRAFKDRRDGQKTRELAKGASTVVSKRRESFRVKEKLESGDAEVGSFGRKGNGSKRVGDDHYVKIKQKLEVSVNSFAGYGVVPKATEAELIAAGWPSSLASVAGEAINGWLPRKADTFEKLDKIGQGTYSSVYKARDLVNDKVVALKRVRFDKMDPESIKFMAREIVILRRLDHPNIIKLEGLVVSRASCSLYLVFEYMEHDLTGLASVPGIKFTEPQVKCYMRQLLSGLDHCHNRGVLHRDIKGSNLLIDNNGALKIADFGLANFFDNQQSVPLTSRVVTLWYRPPELLLGASHYGAAVDLWSTGCILGELYVAKPIMPGRTEVEQLHKIFKLCGSPTADYWEKTKLSYSAVFKPVQPYKRRIGERFKVLPPSAVGLLETLLSIDPSLRGTAAGALESEFFTTKPFACDPLTLPTYPPSKEIDAKLREEEAKRQANANGSKERQAAPADDANAKLARSMQGKQSSSNPKSQSDRFNPQKVAASGFRNDPPKASQAVKETVNNHLENLSERFSANEDLSETFSHSVPLALGVGGAKSGTKYDDISIGLNRADLSNFAASRSVVSGDAHDTARQVDRRVRLLDEHSRKQDGKYLTQNYTSSHQFESGRTSSKEANLNDHGYEGNKIYFSGSLLAQSSKVDQMLKDHDRQIQEATRRARLEKARAGQAQARGM
ncbi:PREDICTED: probable serine/threonine-protein kinase At1g54610 isoform X2 [Nicotiana attenuata]|uniref:probable serine/threonine-protein kinase At1g54610 isoform X2 n=1 Tax=Nicotiana attenuata TaxID=49451 RepID=UPI00090592C2|nr:PREDICTED: probable serine/threonine-protein kinase At1g54610 isoform X2 [Nicotiana attenuata]